MDASNKLPSNVWYQAGVLVLIFAAYVLTARFGLFIYPVHTYATLVWPPAGIALAAFLLYGYRVWPAIYLAALAVNLSIGAPILLAFVIATGNTFGPGFAARMLRQYSAYHPLRLRLHDNLGIVLSAVVVPLFTATIGASALLVSGSIGNGAFVATWTTWFIGDSLGILVFTPLIWNWSNPQLYVRTWQQYIELVFILGIIAGASYYIFWSPRSVPEEYLFLPLTWAALRTGPRGTTLSILVVAILSFAGTLLGQGPFVERGLVALQILIGVVSGTVLTIASIVEERRHALETLEDHVQELEIALKKIRSEDEAKKEFLAVLAHELRNPLATILSSIELIHMEARSIPAVISDLLATVNERARSMVHLLDDLLDISRISHNKLKMEKEVLQLDQFIDALVTAVQPIIRRYEHSLSVTKPEQELYLEADPSRLEQIFVNLVTNAAKYTQAPGNIQIMAKREGGMVAIHVCDSGVGIPKKMLQRIFEPFFQVDQEQPNGQGLGVGLAITRQLVEMHDGTIEAKSAGADAGSQFIVRLPLTTARKAPARAAVPDTTKPRRKAPATARRLKHVFKILIVDDNEASANALARLLELRGHETAFVYTGGDALPKVRKFKPDVVLLDIGLPDMSGYDVAALLRTQKRQQHLIALTGYGQNEDKERAKAAGFDYHLTKPVGFKEIEDVLRKLPSPAAKKLRPKKKEKTVSTLLG